MFVRYNGKLLLEQLLTHESYSSRYLLPPGGDMYIEFYRGLYFTWPHTAHKISVLYSLVHVEGEVDVLFLGEEQNEKVITCLTLLDGGIQTDLLRKKQRKSVRGSVRYDKAEMFIWRVKTFDRKGTKVPLPQRTSASDPCVAAGKDGGRWCRESCSQRFYHAGEGKWGRYGCHI